MTMRAAVKKILIIVICASVAGCMGSLLESKLQVPTVYVLASAPAASAPTTPLNADIAVAYPTAAPGLDTEHIAILHESRRLDYYRDSQWGGALPQVVQALFVSSLQNQNSFRSVTTEQARVSSGYLLDLDIRAFQAEYANDSSPPTIRVTLVGSVIRVRDRKLLATVPATFSVTASANRMNAVVEAFESAAQQAATTIGKGMVDAIGSEH